MVPRRRRSWFSRLGSIAGPERIGAALVVLTVFGEGRHHADTVQADATEALQVVRARVIGLERARDTLAVRVAYLERQRLLERRRRHGHRVADEPDPYGPHFAPEERGHLLASVGKAFRRLVFFLP